ncbi:MAG: DUF4239 domain-containing protein [Solirubrobacterales bacterium]
MRELLHTYDHYLLASIALGGTFAAAFLLLWLANRSRHAGEISAFRGLSPPFVNVVGVLFALTLAFLANDTWNAHDRALNATFQEAGSLRSIQALAAGLPAQAQGRIEQALIAYVTEAVGREWPMLAKRESSSSATERLSDLLAVVSSADVAQSITPTVHTLMLQQVVQVRALREQRIALSQTHVNPLKWVGMAFLGFLTMVSIALVYIEQPKAELLAVMLFSAAAAPTAAIVLVQGNPFQEPTAVSPAPIGALIGR